MQDHPNLDGDRRARRPRHGQTELQRRVLLELLTDAPEAGDRLGELADRLGASAAELLTAVTELARDGLVLATDGRVQASTAARRFEALWPIRP
jgi:DNA-binding Lrp family transcriptional regulator